jgi:hypothetical protein
MWLARPAQLSLAGLAQILTAKQILRHCPATHLRIASAKIGIEDVALCKKYRQSPMIVKAD